MEVNKIYNESCLDTLKSMPDKFINCVVTSPPYWQLRDYGYEGQWGMEPTFQEYLEHLWQMMDQIYRVLKEDGTVWINLGDTYSGGGGGNYGNGLSVSDDDTRSKHIRAGAKLKTGLKAKCLLLLPHRFAIGCIDRGFVMRNDIIWAKPNGMPESCTDRFSKKHEYFFFMTKNKKYFFDLDAIRDKHKQASIDRWKRGVSENNKWVNGAGGQTPHNLSKPRPNTKYNQEFPDTAVGNIRSGGNELHDKGKNPGDVADFWDISTKSSSENHFAAYNEELLRKPILAGCPEGGLIYDPFMGTGTTAEVALRANRMFIGSEMNPKDILIANRRLLPFISQEKMF